MQISICESSLSSFPFNAILSYRMGESRPCKAYSLKKSAANRRNIMLECAACLDAGDAHHTFAPPGSGGLGGRARGGWAGRHAVGAWVGRGLGGGVAGLGRGLRRGMGYSQLVTGCVVGRSSWWVRRCWSGLRGLSRHWPGSRAVQGGRCSRLSSGRVGRCRQW